VRGHFEVQASDATRFPRPDVNFPMTFRILLFGLIAVLSFASDDSEIAGSWTGESACTGARASCVDEHVTWTFKVPDGSTWARASDSGIAKTPLCHGQFH
jgi:hypothetical protein